MGTDFLLTFTISYIVSTFCTLTSNKIFDTNIFLFFYFSRCGHAHDSFRLAHTDSVLLGRSHSLLLFITLITHRKTCHLSVLDKNESGNFYLSKGNDID